MPQWHNDMMVSPFIGRNKLWFVSKLIQHVINDKQQMIRITGRLPHGVLYTPITPQSHKILVITYANDSHVSKVFSSVCLSVRTMNDHKLFKPHVVCFGFKRSKVRLKHIEGNRVAGMSFCTLSSARTLCYYYYYYYYYYNFKWTVTDYHKDFYWLSSIHSIHFANTLSLFRSWNSLC